MKYTHKEWLFMIFSSLFILFFQLNYCTSVCPFADSLDDSVIIRNIIIVFFAHIIIRYIIAKLVSKPSSKITIYRKKYLLSVVSWIFAGILAAFIHYGLYDFPISSTAKVLTGYLLIGGGILAQFEYMMFEYEHHKNPTTNTGFSNSENLSKRLLESFIIFTLLPTLTMILVFRRYKYEGLIDDHLSTEILYVGFFAVVSSIIVAYLFGKLIAKDTKKITDTISLIHSGNYDIALNIGRADELGSISNGINFMNKGLKNKKEIQEAFGKFVDPRIADEFINNYITNKSGEFEIVGEKKQVVVLMCDIRNFTPLSESLDSNDIVSILNDYFSMSVDIIQENNGIVNKFIGDAVMAVFGLYGNKEEKEKYALDTAIEMQEKLKEINKGFEQRGYPSINIGIGLHTGEVTAGYVGTDSRFEFTVIGSTVNAAARIESETKKYSKQILFSEDFNSKINGFKTYYVADASLKGIEKPVKLYSVD